MTNEEFDEINRKSKEVWEKFIKLQPETDLMFPDENLIRIFSGRYVKVPTPPAKLLDHGFGGGNNLLFFASKGYECYGCEISEELIKVAKKKFDKINYPIVLKSIRGDFLDFEDNFFDVIVSWNVLHYLGVREKVMKIINEFYRILKPNGVLILSTIHPDNSIFQRMKPINDNSFEIVEKSWYDNREGLTFFVTSRKEDLISLFSIFSKVKYGSYNFNLFLPDKIQASQLIYAIK